MRAINDARTADGKPVETPDPLSQGVLFSDFAEAVASAATPEKRTALVHAAARQFDPELGTLAVRKHWFDRVSQLTDVEILALRVLAKEGPVFEGTNGELQRVPPGKALVFDLGTPPKGNGVLAYPPDTLAAVRSALEKLSRGEYVAGDFDEGTVYISRYGEVLLRYIGEN